VADVDSRLFLTFTAAMDRARDADALWHASERLFLEQRWVFEPQEVQARPSIELDEALRSHRVSQRHTKDSEAWRVISRSLAERDAPPVNDAIETGRGDAEELLAALTRRDRNGSALFPLLQGPKIGTTWVRMLAYPGGAEITSLEVLPVAVDVQVRKLTEYLGVTDTVSIPLETARRIIQRTWLDEVRRDGAEGPEPLADTASALDPALQVGLHPL
jgi:hypothetical protein